MLWASFADNLTALKPNLKLIRMPRILTIFHWNNWKIQNVLLRNWCSIRSTSIILLLHWICISQFLSEFYILLILFQTLKAKWRDGAWRVRRLDQICCFVYAFSELSVCPHYSLRRDFLSAIQLSYWNFNSYLVVPTKVIK